MSGDSTLVDGRTGSTAKVDKSNRLHTLAVSRPEATQALVDGDGFTITTGAITLTSDSPSALLYIKNTGVDLWVLTRLFCNTGDSTGGADTYVFEVIGAPVSGTLISAGDDGEAANLNFGSPSLLASVIKIGVEGSTIVPGNPIIDSIVPEGRGRLLISGDPLAIPGGTSAAIRVTPPVGNTSMTVQVGVVLYIDGGE